MESEVRVKPKKTKPIPNKPSNTRQILSPNAIPERDAEYWKKEFQEVKKKADQLEMDKLDLKIELQKVIEDNGRLKEEIREKKISGKILSHLKVNRKILYILF